MCTRPISTAEEDLDLVVFLGDYIYEGTLTNPGPRLRLPPEPARAEPMTLAQYRYRYAVYKSDEHLQAAHARFPWIVTPDDHEVEKTTRALRRRSIRSPTRTRMDAWDGYDASRDRIIAGIVNRKVDNVVVLTGDVHANYAADLKANFDDPTSQTLGSGFAGTSLASGGNGSDTTTGPPPSWPRIRTSRFTMHSAGT